MEMSEFHRLAWRSTRVPFPHLGPKITWCCSASNFHQRLVRRRRSPEEIDTMIATCTSEMIALRANSTGSSDAQMFHQRQEQHAGAAPWSCSFHHLRAECVPVCLVFRWLPRRRSLLWR